MKLEEAINHCEEVLERDDMCEECKQEHKQLAMWLKELKLLRDKSYELYIRKEDEGK